MCVHFGAEYSRPAWPGRHSDGHERSDRGNLPPLRCCKGGSGTTTDTVNGGDFHDIQGTHGKRCTKPRCSLSSCIVCRLELLVSWRLVFVPLLEGA